MSKPSSFPLLLLVGCVLGALPSCGVLLDEEARLERARQAYVAGDLSSAIVDLKALLQDDGDHVDARLLLGEALFRTGDLPGSEKEFERAVELLRQSDQPAGGDVVARPNVRQELVETTGKLAALQLALREFAPALTNAEFVLSEYPNNVAAYVIASQSAFATGDNAQSRSYAARLLEHSPGNPTAHAMLGFLDAREGAHTEAEQHFNAVLAEQPDHHAVRLALTQMQIVMGKPDAAVATLAPVLVAVPTNEQLLQLLDVIQLGGPEARASVEAVAAEIEQRNSTSPVPGLLRGRSLLLAREYSAAAMQFRTAMANGGGRYPLVGYYVAARAAGDRQAAQQALEQWVEANPSDQGTGFMLASDYLDQSQNDRARALYGKLVGTTEVDSPIVLNNLAWLYGEINDSRAIETARQAHQLAPDNGAITDTLGWLLVRAGEHEEGIRLLRLAVEQAPDADEIRYHLATALAEAGDLGDAQRQIEQILRGPVAPSLPPQGSITPR